MKSWTLSSKYIDQLRRNRLWMTILAAVWVWGRLVCSAAHLSRFKLWALLHSQRPAVADIGNLLYVVCATLPFWSWLFYTKIIRRARATTFQLNEAAGWRQILRVVEGETSSLSLDTLSEIQVFCAADVRLIRIRLIASGGRRLDAGHLENFDDFLAALRAAAPSCPVKEWTMPAALRIIGWVGMAVLLGLGAAAVHGNINRNIFVGVTWILMVSVWFIAQVYIPMALPGDGSLFSYRLGKRYLWLDFAFAG